MAAVLGLVVSQSPDNEPLSKDAITRMFNNLIQTPNRSNIVKKEVERVGVDFELDTVTEREFRGMGMDQALLEAIRHNTKITSLTVQCQVDCQVSVNGEVRGTTHAGVLTVSPVKPGLVTVHVSAPPNFEDQTAEVPISPGKSVTHTFTMEPRKGALKIKCVPAPVCAITVKGKNNNPFSNSGETSQQSFTVQGLSLGEYEVEAKAPPDYFPKTQTVWIPSPELHNLTIELVEDPWGSKTPLQVYDAILGSLGGKEIHNFAKYTRNSARMSLTGDPAAIGNLKEVQVVELVAPNRLRWDMTIPGGSKWHVTFDGSKTGSGGDKKKYGGTPLAQELESSIRLFSAMRLPSVLSQILDKFDIKKGPNLVLVADSHDDRYTFYLNEDFLPLKLLHEHLTAPASREEIEFGQYKSIGQDLKLPYVMILRYPERSRHEQVFQYEKIEPTPQMREEQFRP
jgi:hypothetical protein